MSTIVNISIDQGSNFDTTIQVVNESGNVRNLSNCTARSQMRKTYTSFSNTEFTVTIDNPNEGEINLSMTGAKTANIKYGRYVYDLVLTDGSLKPERVVEGIVTVYPGVTKP